MSGRPSSSSNTGDLLVRPILRLVSRQSTPNDLCLQCLGGGGVPFVTMGLEAGFQCMFHKGPDIVSSIPRAAVEQSVFLFYRFLSSLGFLGRKG